MKNFFSAIWELFVSMLWNLKQWVFNLDEETENEQWLRERTK